MFRSLKQQNRKPTLAVVAGVTGSGRGVERVNNPINHTAERATPSVPHFLLVFNDSNTPLSLRGFPLLSSKERNGKTSGLGLDGGGCSIFKPKIMDVLC